MKCTPFLNHKKWSPFNQTFRALIRRRIPGGPAAWLISIVLVMLSSGSPLHGQGRDDALFIDQEGRVGIGTNAPGAALDVEGTVKARHVTATETMTTNKLKALEDTTLQGSVGINRDPAKDQHLAILPDKGKIPLNVTDPDNKKNWLTVFSDGHVVMNGGSVGVGTADPKGFQVVVPESDKAPITGPGITFAGGKEGNADIELRNAGEGTPYIDFSQGTDKDYDARIVLSSKEELEILGEKLSVNVNGTMRVTGALNGEDPPMTFRVGDPHDQTTWLAEERDIGALCGDEDGCRIRLLLQHELNDGVRTITEEIYIEQPDISNNKAPGLHGWTRQSGGGDYSWVLDWPGHVYHLFSPWNWFWAENFTHENVHGKRGPAFTGKDKYKIEFMSHPNVTATVIIYDR